MQLVEATLVDNLSNLATALVSIERGEGAGRETKKLESARERLVETVRGFHGNRFALGRALAEYRKLYREDQLWLRAQREIATALGCHPRTVSRIIEESKAAAALSPFVLEAMEERKIDPGKKKNAALVDELLRCPIPESRDGAESDVERVAAKHFPRRRRAPKPSPESIEAFARRMVRLFSGRFKSEPPAAQVSGLRYCLEMILAALHSDVTPLRVFDSLDEVPKPTPDARKKPKEAGVVAASSAGRSTAKRFVS